MSLAQNLRRITTSLLTRLAPSPPRAAASMSVSRHPVLLTSHMLPPDWPPTAVRTNLSTDDLRLVLLYLQWLDMDLLWDAGRGGGLFPSGFAELLRLHWDAEVVEPPFPAGLPEIELYWNWEGPTQHPDTGERLTLEGLPALLQERGLSRYGVGASLLTLEPHHIDEDPAQRGEVARAMLSPFAAEDTPAGWWWARAWVNAQAWPPAATWPQSVALAQHTPDMGDCGIKVLSTSNLPEGGFPLNVPYEVTTDHEEVVIDQGRRYVAVREAEGIRIVDTHLPSETILAWLAEGTEVVLLDVLRDMDGSYALLQLRPVLPEYPARLLQHELSGTGGEGSPYAEAYARVARGLQHALRDYLITHPWPGKP